MIYRYKVFFIFLLINFILCSNYNYSGFHIKGGDPSYKGNVSYNYDASKAGNWSESDKNQYFINANKKYNSIGGCENAYQLGWAYYFSVGTDLNLKKSADLFEEAKKGLSCFSYSDVMQSRVIQTALNMLGYDCGRPDGVMGDKTNKAIQRCVRDYELVYDKYVDYSDRYGVHQIVELAQSRISYEPSISGGMQINSGCDIPLNTLYLSDSGEVYYNSSDDIAGFQFNVDGASILGASGGAAQDAGFTVSTGGATVLGFSFTNSIVPSGCGTLVNIDLDGRASSLLEIIIADPDGNPFDVSYYDESLEYDIIEDEAYDYFSEEGKADFMSQCMKGGYGEELLCECSYVELTTRYPTAELLDNISEEDFNGVISYCNDIVDMQDQILKNDEVLFLDNFNKGESDWYTEGRTYYYSNGYYVLETSTGNVGPSLYPIDIDLNRDFEIKTEIVFEKDVDDYDSYGIVWGAAWNDEEGSVSDASYFSLSNAGDYTIWTDGESEWTVSDFINTGKNSVNELKIQKINEDYKFFINGILVDTRPFKSDSFYGNYIGFQIRHPEDNNYKKMKVNYLKVLYLGDQNNSQYGNLNQSNFSSNQTANIENVVLNEEFNSNNNNKWWEGKQGADFNTFTSSGKYFINTNKGFQVRAGIPLDLDYNNKFSIESDILLADGKSDNSYHGIFWGGSSQFPHGEGDSFNYFIIDPDHNLYRIGKQDNSSGVDLELLESGWVETTFLKSNNNIKIDRDGNEYKIYINGQLIDVVTGLDSEGEYIGFLCYESDIKIENLLVSEIESDNSNLDYSNINKPVIEEIDMSMFFIPEGSPGSAELLRNNQYLLDSESDEGAVAFLYYDFNTSNDFDIQFKFKYNSFNDDDDAGIALSWGSEEALFVAGLMNNNTFAYGNVLEGAPILKDVDLPSQIRKNSFNELLIKKRANKYEFYLNNKMIAKAPFQIFSGELLAVEMSPYQKAVIDKIVYTAYPKNKNSSDEERRLKEFGDYHALLIGVSDYQYDCDNDIDGKWSSGECKGLLDLPSIKREMRLLESVLLDEYDFKTVKVLDSPTRSEIFTWITHFEQRLSKNDNFLLFYSGHGEYSEAHRGRAYWYPSDADMGNRASWLPDSEIKDFISALKSDHVLVMTDACMAGAFALSKSTDFPTNAKEVFEKQKRKSRTLMTAADIGEYAPGKSEFVKFIIQELQLNENFLSSEELYNNIKRPIKVNTIDPNDPDGNTPIRAILEGDAGGDFIFVK